MLRPFMLLLFGISIFIDLHGKPLSFRNINSSDGLPHNTVFCITQDTHGFMWFGTRFGVCRYDGNRFISYNTSNSGLINNAIRDILQVNDSIFYIATEGGIASLNLHTNVITSMTFGQVTFKPRILDMKKDHSGNIWIATEGDGVFCIKDGVIKRYMHPEFVVNILCSSDNRQYALSERLNFSGFYLLNDTTDTFVKILDIKAMTAIEGEDFSGLEHREMDCLRSPPKERCCPNISLATIKTST